MNAKIRQHDLEAFLEEALPPAEMARIEDAARSDAALRAQLALVHSQRDSGVHSVGEIWRRHRLTCPGRGELGSYVLGALGPEQSDYIRFHLEVIGCRYCAANLADLENRERETADSSTHRRRRYFQSSAGYLRR